jgi:hypothetical protein
LDEVKSEWANDKLMDNHSNSKAIGSALTLRNTIDHIESLGEQE